MVSKVFCYYYRYEEVKGLIYFSFCLINCLRIGEMVNPVPLSRSNLKCIYT